MIRGITIISLTSRFWLLSGVASGSISSISCASLKVVHYQTLISGLFKIQGQQIMGPDLLSLPQMRMTSKLIRIVVIIIITRVQQMMILIVSWGAKMRGMTLWETKMEMMIQGKKEDPSDDRNPSGIISLDENWKDTWDAIPPEEPTCPINLNSSHHPHQWWSANCIK